MKKKIAVLLTAALMASASINVMAEEDITGEWYANLYGIASTLTLEESGEYTMTMDMEDDEPGVGSWEFDGEILIMDKGEDTEVSFTYDGEVLYTNVEGMDMIYSRDPEAVVGFVPAEICADAELEDFAGDWACTLMSTMGMTVSLEMMEMEEVALSIKENLITFTMKGGFMFGDWDIPDLEGELKDGALTLTIPAEDEYSEDMEWNIRVHEDGMLSLTTTMMDEDFTFYMEPAVEETEEVTE